MTLGELGKTLATTAKLHLEGSLLFTPYEVYRQTSRSERAAARREVKETLFRLRKASMKDRKDFFIGFYDPRYSSLTTGSVAEQLATSEIPHTTVGELVKKTNPDTRRAASLLPYIGFDKSYKAKLLADIKAYHPQIIH